MLNPDSYIVIQSWMVTDLKLKGLDLLLYAIIYGFSQDGSSSFTGSLSYLMDWTNSSNFGVRKSLTSLVDRGLLFKDETFVKGVKRCSYRVVPMAKYLVKGG